MTLPTPDTLAQWVKEAEELKNWTGINPAHFITVIKQLQAERGEGREGYSMIPSQPQTPEALEQIRVLAGSIAVSDGTVTKGDAIRMAKSLVALCGALQAERVERKAVSPQGGGSETNRL